MGRLGVSRFESARQEWATPQALFDALDERYGFEFDLAADASNAKCEIYFGKEDDALSRQWVGRCWLNPPYGGAGRNRLAEWVAKAHDEAQTGRCSVTMLIPARTNTRWWHRYCMSAAEVLFIEGRPKFGDAAHGLPLPLAVVTFDRACSGPVFGGLSARTFEVSGV